MGGGGGVGIGDVMDILFFNFLIFVSFWMGGEGV